MVQGHVDGTGELISTTREGNAYRMRFGFPRELGRYIAMKGSICVDGISLTIAVLGESNFDVQIVPHTWTHTNLQAAAVFKRRETIPERREAWTSCDRISARLST